jgi:ADP-heptose:LPS heptosyltransferase
MTSSIEEAPQRIVVFRALMLGDLLCAVPALRALRAAYPAAEITLVGLPWARALTHRLSHLIDDFIVFPGHPAFPEGECNVRAWPDFLAQVHARRFDLAIQLHGSGVIANALVATFGARQIAGFAGPGAWVPPDDADLFCPWPESGHEIERLLRLTDHLGMPRQGHALEFPIDDDDRHQLRALWPDAGAGRPYVGVHAGAQLPSRRWHPRRFAEVGDALAERGYTVVLTGSQAETGLVGDVAACMQHAALNLCGHTTLWTLGALIEGAAAVVCNDTGVSHVAAALGRPSVVVSCGSDPTRWAPLDRVRHRVLAHAVPCRPCTHVNCPTAHECASAIDAPQVLRWIAPLRPRSARKAPSSPSVAAGVTLTD